MGREEADSHFSLKPPHTAYTLACNRNLSPSLSSTIGCWPSSGSDWSDLMEDLDASCLPPAQQTGLVDQTAQLGLFWRRLFVLGKCWWKELLVCSSGNWSGTSWIAADHYMWVPTGACWSSWWGVRAPPQPDNEEGCSIEAAAAAQLGGLS